MIFILVEMVLWSIVDLTSQFDPPLHHLYEYLRSSTARPVNALPHGALLVTGAKNVLVDKVPLLNGGVSPNQRNSAGLTLSYDQWHVILASSGMPLLISLSELSRRDHAFCTALS